MHEIAKPFKHKICSLVHDCVQGFRMKFQLLILWKKVAFKINMTKYEPYSTLWLLGLSQSEQTVLSGMFLLAKDITTWMLCSRMETQELSCQPEFLPKTFHIFNQL